MNSFENIIGYESVITELKRIADVLKNPAKYEKLGVKEPQGLLLYGSPGLGKTLMATEFIEATGRECFVCRKTKSSSSFIDEIKKTFDDAVKSAPAIILLDDLDKFSNSNVPHSKSDAFITIQSCIDDVKSKHVYVIATVNDKYVLPDSLTRSGRFDDIVELNAPSGDTAKKIISYYLSKMKIIDKTTIEKSAKILSGNSTAEIESIINDAGMRAGYLGKNIIEFDDIVNSYVRKIFDAPETSEYDNKAYLDIIAYHEAGHTVMCELLEPGAISLVSVMNNENSKGGVTSYVNNDSYFYDITYMKNRIMAILGGKAATELVYGKPDVGCNDDIHRAFDIASRFVDNYCLYGFNSFERDECSDGLRDRKDQRVGFELDKYYSETKELLAKNRAFLDAVAKELMSKKILTFDDISKIRNSVKINDLRKVA